jgi:hypothetical protein
MGSKPRPGPTEAIKRRRTLAASAPLQPTLASKFSTAELAVLCIVSKEIDQPGICDLRIDDIATMAGTRRTIVQSAISEAKRLGIVAVQERRHSNIVEWVRRKGRAIPAGSAVNPGGLP